MLFRVHVKLRASSLLVFWFTFFCFCRLKRFRREWFLCTSCLCYYVVFLPLIYCKHLCILSLPFLLEKGGSKTKAGSVYIFKTATIFTSYSPKLSI